MTLHGVSEFFDNFQPNTDYTSDGQGGEDRMGRNYSGHCTIFLLPRLGVSMRPKIASPLLLCQRVTARAEMAWAHVLHTENTDAIN